MTTTLVTLSGYDAIGDSIDETVACAVRLAPNGYREVQIGSSWYTVLPAGAVVLPPAARRRISGGGTITGRAPVAPMWSLA